MLAIDVIVVNQYLEKNNAADCVFEVLTRIVELAIIAEKEEGKNKK